MISNALAFAAANSKHGALLIIVTKRNAVIVPEIKFREIAVQMLLAAMLVHALHAALEDREVAFG